MMQTQQDAISWDRHQILAEIKRRYGSLTKLGRKRGLSATNLSVVFNQPYEAGERIIASAIDQPLHKLWPDRWDNNGNRLAVKANPAPPALASQKTNPPRTKTGEVRT